jgi:transglutaminase-like putative cysteine protease
MARISTVGATLRLRASCTLAIETRAETPLVLMLRARRNEGQRVVEERLSVRPALAVTAFQDLYGNVCERLVAGEGSFTVQSHVVAEVPSHVAVCDTAPRTPVARLPSSVLHFTLPSRYCPSDKLLPIAKEATAQRAPGYAEVAGICEYVRAKLAYAYGVSDSSTDALDTLRQGAGVCRDFAHVAVSLCRSLDIPARIAVGYLHRREPMDLHAWFEAFLDGRWYTFDPTESSLRGGRIVLAYGRDAADVAFLTDYGALRLNSMSVAVHECIAASDRGGLQAVG